MKENEAAKNNGKVTHQAGAKQRVSEEYLAYFKLSVLIW